MNTYGPPPPIPPRPASFSSPPPIPPRPEANAPSSSYYRAQENHNLQMNGNPISTQYSWQPQNIPTYPQQSSQYNNPGPFPRYNPYGAQPATQQNERPPALPPRRPSAQNENARPNQYAPPPSATQYQPPPPPPGPPPNSWTGNGEGGGNGGSGGGSGDGSGGGDSTGNKGWGPFFYPDGIETPLFEEFITAIFHYLDPHRTGLMRPEVYSSFLDAMGAPLRHNGWKSSLKPLTGHTPEDNADYEFLLCLQGFDVDHVVQQRHSKPPPPHGGMPLMTLKGFVDINTIEATGEPEFAWRGFNKIIRTYGIWQDRGDIPRSCFLPDVPHQAAERIKLGQGRIQKEAHDRVAAAAAYARMANLGRIQAMNITDDRYYYVPSSYY